MKIFFKIIFIIILLAGALFALSIVSYFGMLAYFAYKDDTTYEYKHYQCDGKSFISPLPFIRFRYRDSGTTYISDKMGDVRYEEFLTQYPEKSQFKFLKLYSTYDFETGTFFKYLIEDKEGHKSFIHFDEIDPIKCSYDINDTYWFKNNRKYLPKEGENAIKIPYSSLKNIFRTKNQKGK